MKHWGYWKKYTAAAMAVMLTAVSPAAAYAGEDAAEAAEEQSTAAESDTAETTAADKNSACDLEDGQYKNGQFAFAWKGGSGRVTISCDQITVKDGAVTAGIEFSSENYTYVKVDGETFDEPDHSQGTSIFEIPVQFNADTAIIGQTTAMSTPHEIEYTLYFGDTESAPDWAAEAGEGSTVTAADGDSLEQDSSDDTESDQSEQAAADDQTASETEADADNGSDTSETAPEIEGLTYDSKMDLDYATGFDVYYYNDGYKLLSIHDHAQYLVVPEGKDAPEGLDDSIVVLYQPLNKIYMAATAIMSLFDSIDALDSIRFSSLEADSWYVENAKAAMENGDMVYAGKYSEPDYELLVGEECDLAIESTMILHTPKVQEMIEDLDIPVLTDYSSYESHPLGRTEWIKFYAALLNKEDQAKEFFDSQAQIVKDLEGFDNTEKTVAFFYVSTDGTVVVRSSSDYIPKMIEIAGGRYIFKDLYATEGKKSSVSMTMEEFYNEAVDADYLIYNATIDNPIDSMDGLLEKSDLFADFKAVQDGNVWCCGKYLYQATNTVGTMIEDFHEMLTDGDESQMTFLTKIE